MLEWKQTRLAATFLEFASHNAITLTF